MGTFTSKLRVWNPSDPERADEIELLVDTGASFSWISRERLEPLGIRPTGRMEFRTIEGHLIERDVAPVFMAADGRTGGDTVVLAEREDLEVLGAHSLECMGLGADVLNKRLVTVIGLALAAVLPVSRIRD